MDNPRMKDIVAKQKTCYFISPHYDDMAYSAGLLARDLSKTNRIVVITIFTAGGKRPYTRAAKKWMKRCGYGDAERFFADRGAENAVALKDIADEIIDLGFADAPWREKPGRTRAFLAKFIPKLGNVRGGLSYYYHAQKGNPAKADTHTFAQVREKLQEIVSEKNAQVFCPLGTGGHFDHTMTRSVCDVLFTDPIYWSDYPYNLKHGPSGVKDLQTFTRSGDATQKREIIEAYVSQYDAMFGANGPQIIDETFYYKEAQL